MAKRDYYEVLGVSRKASPEEIKKAYRSRARQLHPDVKGSGDEAAFKELSEAYDVLFDSQKRALYDRYGHEGVKGNTRSFDDIDFSSFAGFGIDDIIEVFFGGGLRSGGRRGGPEPGAHLKYDLQIEFLDAVFGVDKKVSIKRMEECTTCDGTGAAQGSNITTCASCAGIGQVQQVVNSWFGQSIRVMECPTCQGNGRKIEKPCRDCRGEGLLKKARDFDFSVPAGVESGSRIRLSSAGDKGRRGGPYGDLFIIIHVKEHEKFVRDGDTIHYNQPISFSMAALGGEIIVPTVEGEKLLKIAPGTQTGTMIVMKGLGVPRLGNPARRGDQLVHLTVTTPTKLSSEERKLLEKLAQLRSESLNVAPDKSAPEAGSPASAQDKPIASGKPDDKPSKNGDDLDKQQDESQTKEDPSLFERIVEVFRPKNGEHEDK
ncbi:MAG: molecular chaperone DnaJ [Candidatus Melainabacteria bacterium]|nr:MAG: molecular chaperone DnaJ [Candidatus Melainabacteria bacterium]